MSSSALPLAAGTLGRTRAHPARTIAIYIAIGSVIATISFTRRYFDALADGLDRSPWPLLVDEFSAGWLAALLILLVVHYALRLPLRRHWPLWLAIAPLYAVCHTLGMYLSRSALYPLLGLGEYHYGDLGYRFLMEAPVQLLGYVLTLIGVAIYAQLRRARDAERLEALLTESRLEQIRLSIAPHFLFNTLNVISAAAYESPEKADGLIGKLSALLRSMLSVDARQTWQLGEELAALNEYLDLQRARFEESLSVDIDIDESLRTAEVPRMILQPLLENALEHGLDRNGQAHVRIGAKRIGDRLLVTIADGGAGPGEFSEGIGLRNTRERLQRLYGEQYGYALDPLQPTGSQLRLSMPWREAS